MGTSYGDSVNNTSYRGARARAVISGSQTDYDTYSHIYWWGSGQIYNGYGSYAYLTVTGRGTTKQISNPDYSSGTWCYVNFALDSSTDITRETYDTTYTVSASYQETYQSGGVSTAYYTFTIPALQKFTYTYKEYIGDGTSTPYRTHTRDHYFGRANTAKTISGSDNPGFWFSGWTYNGQTYLPGVDTLNVNANITLEGHWYPYEQNITIYNDDDCTPYELSDDIIFKYGEAPSSAFYTSFLPYKEYFDSDPYKDAGYTVHGWYECNEAGEYVDINSKVFDENQDPVLSNTDYWTADGEFHHAGVGRFYLRHRRTKNPFNVSLVGSNLIGTSTEYLLGNYLYKTSIDNLPTTISSVPDGYVFTGVWDGPYSVKQSPVYKKFTETSTEGYITNLEVPSYNAYLSAVYRDITPTSMYYISSSFTWTRDSTAEGDILPQYFNYVLGRNSTFNELEGQPSHTVCGCIKFYSPNSDILIDKNTILGSRLLNIDNSVAKLLDISNIGVYYYNRVCYLLFYARDNDTIVNSERYNWVIKPSNEGDFVLDTDGKPLLSSYTVSVKLTSVIADVNKNGTSITIGDYASDDEEKVLKSYWEIDIVNSSGSRYALNVLTPSTDATKYYTLYHSPTELKSGIYKVPEGTSIKYLGDSGTFTFNSDGIIEVYDGISDNYYKFASAKYSLEPSPGQTPTEVFQPFSMYSSISGTNGGIIYGSGGGGGVTDYDLLSNRPSINGVTLTGNKTWTNLGLEVASITRW